MAGSGRRHDRDVLDALEAMADEPFEGEVWRVTWAGRDPLRGSTGAGRWSPAGEFEVLYTSLAREGALAEVGHRLSLEPVWPDPSRARHEVHRIGASLGRVLRFETVQSLHPLGVNTSRWGSYDYGVTQAIAAAANFLEIGGEAYTKAEVALDLVLSNPGVRSLVVNFCGAFARTDVMAEGVVRAWEALRPSVPAFFSIHGTGEEAAVKLVRDRLGIEPYDLMEDAVKAAIEAAR